MDNVLGTTIAQKRKELGYTQQTLAEQLNISFQAISKWENGTSSPDISLLPKLAGILQTSVDVLVGHDYKAPTSYEEKYRCEDYYWGITPNHLCYEIMKLRPPVKPYRVLDIGCGEGKDAVFLAKNGYQVTAFDIAESGLEKARKLAEHNHVNVDFFKADLNSYRPTAEFDIVFSSGVFHYLEPKERAPFLSVLKECTSPNGLHALNVFIAKPFLETAPDTDIREREQIPWHSGELYTYYHDWMFHRTEEFIFDCNSGGIPHKHCMNRMIAEKIQ